LVLDSGGHLPSKLRLPWLLGPPLFYLATHLINPALERSTFGLSMLGLNIYSLLSLWLLLKGPGYHAASEDQ
jgi:hypothetical protein